MTSIEPLEFSSNSMGGMTDLNKKDNPPAPMPETGKDATQDLIGAQRETIDENNNTISKEQMMELATPLSEVMGPDPQEQQMMQQQMMAPSSMPAPMPDPPMHPPAVASPEMYEQQAPRKGRKPKKQNPGGLTDEQMDALLVALVAAIAFSPQLKSKMVEFVPSLFTEDGARTMGGVALTGLIAAGLYVGAKRMLQ